MDFTAWRISALPPYPSAIFNSKAGLEKFVANSAPSIASETSTPKPW